MVHGYSKTVIHCLDEAATTGIKLNILVTEGRPAGEGYDVIKALEKSSLNLKLISDTAVASLLTDVDLVLFGAGVITENGGIINTVGTYQTALLASMLKKPVCVCADKLKFAKLYPLDQSDLPPARKAKFKTCDDSVSSDYLVKQSVDYTPPQYITRVCIIFFIIFFFHRQ